MIPASNRKQHMHSPESALLQLYCWGDHIIKEIKVTFATNLFISVLPMSEAEGATGKILFYGLQRILENW